MGEGRLTPSLTGRASAAVFPYCRLDDVPGFREKVIKGSYFSARRVVGVVVKCPLLCIAMPTEIGQKDSSRTDCLREECAWWYSRMEECYLACVGKVLRNRDMALQTPDGLRSVVRET